MNVKEIDGKAFSPNDPFPPTAYLQPFVRENTDAGLIFDPDQFVRAYHPSESFKKAFEVRYRRRLFRTHIHTNIRFM